MSNTVSLENLMKLYLVTIGISSKNWRLIWGRFCVPAMVPLSYNIAFSGNPKLTHPKGKVVNLIRSSVATQWCWKREHVPSMSDCEFLHLSGHYTCLQGKKIDNNHLHCSIFEMWKQEIRKISGDFRFCTECHRTVKFGNWASATH